MSGTSSPSTLTVHVPIRFTIHGGRKTVVSDLVRAPSQPRVDNALLKALARAHRWRRMIENGEYYSCTDPGRYRLVWTVAGASTAGRKRLGVAPRLVGFGAISP
jgi:hypothetical protein